MAPGASSPLFNERSREGQGVGGGNQSARLCTSISTLLELPQWQTAPGFAACESQVLLAVQTQRVVNGAAGIDGPRHCLFFFFFFIEESGRDVRCSSGGSPSPPTCRFMRLSNGCEGPSGPTETRGKRESDSQTDRKRRADYRHRLLTL